MKKLLVAGVPAVLVLVAVLSLAASTGSAGPSRFVLRAAAAGQIRPATLQVRTAAGRTVAKELPFISDSTLEAVQEARNVSNGDDRAEGADFNGSTKVDVGSSHSSGGGQQLGFSAAIGCGARNSDGSTRVNQDCTFRRQAEEDIVADPNDPTHLLAGQNDSRIGFNQCGIDFSFSNGRSWGDLLPPFRTKLNDPASDEPVPGDPNRHTIAGGDGTFHTYDAGSDPSVAFDSRGRAFFSCVVFDVASNATGLYVTQSPAGAGGAFFYNWEDRPFTVVEDNSPLVAHDKEFITADTFRGSPNRDNVYVTWTVFRFSSAGGYQQSPIFGSMSTDSGIHWSTPEQISGAAAFCVGGNTFDTSLPANACNFDQAGDPVVLPNGDVQVVFNNGNTPGADGQQLGVHCRPSGDSTAGTAHFNCAAPTQVGRDIATGEPACDFGRGPEECIPGPFIRTNDYPRIITNGQNHLYAVWQDYRNGEFDIQESQSLDGGRTWHEVGTVNPDRGLDHYEAAVDESAMLTDRVGVSYYRSERVPNETGSVLAPCNPDGSVPEGSTSCAGVQQADSDYVLAGGNGSSTPYPFRVISPVFPSPDGIQTGFNGDYSGLIVTRATEAHPIWSDTRNTDPFAPTNGVTHDEDVFSAPIQLPNGPARRSNGVIGHD
jgi:hypothetical protein